MVLFCGREIFWAVLSGKGVVGWCLNSWDGWVLDSWSFVVGSVLLIVRGMVEINVFVKFSTYFFNLFFMLLFCFDSNICRCYVSCILGAFLEGSVWDDEDIVKLLVLALIIFFD